MQKRYPMTQKGAENLREELNKLKNITRPQISKDIAEARGHGDLKENAEYHAAREQQAFCESRIRHIESVVSNIEIIDPSKIKDKEKISFGAKVTLFNINLEKSVSYKIVGDEEANIKNNEISVTSPMARAMIGHRIDDAFYVKTPSGNIEYEVESIEYESNKTKA